MNTLLSSTQAAQIMLRRRARQAEEKCLWERGMQGATLITSEVPSVLLFDPLIVCLMSILALACIATHTTSRYAVAERLWPFLVHLLRWACTVHCLRRREKSGISLLSALANMSWVFLCVHEVPAHSPTGAEGQRCPVGWLLPEPARQQWTVGQLCQRRRIAGDVAPSVCSVPGERRSEEFMFCTGI